MHLQRGSRRLSWSGWAAQCMLLCLLALHGAGLLHYHDEQGGDPECVACQVVNLQAALDLPEYGSIFFLPVLVLFLILLWQGGAAPAAVPFPRPRSRAPPGAF